MIVAVLNKLLVETAKKHYLVNEAFSGDVYEVNAKENKFGCFVCCPQTALRTDGGVIQYHYVLYYIDRLTKDERNLDLVQSDAVNVLKSLVDWVSKEEGIEVGDFQFNLFRHQFDDWCAGAWLEIDFIVPDTDCGEFEFGKLIDLRPVVITENGDYFPVGFDGFSKITVAVEGGRVEELEEEVRELDQKVNDFDQKVNDFDQRVNDFERQIDEIENNIEDLDDATSSLNDRVSGIDSRVDDLEKGNIDFPINFDNLRKVAPYLYEVNYNSVDYDYAQEYFHGGVDEFSTGGCTVVRNGNFIGRNFDWKYNEQVSFVIRTQASKGRHSVVGVAGMNSLTAQFVDSREYSDLYKVLPFFMQDGINDAGLFVELNVVPKKNGFPYRPRTATITLNEVELVRYLLDNFDSVDDVIDGLRNNIAVESYLDEYECHYMIADAHKTFVIEFIDNQMKVIGKNISTNFHIDGVEFNSDGSVITMGDGNIPSSKGIDVYGSGIERWNRVISGLHSDMKTIMDDVIYTRAYTEINPDYVWYSEFVGGDITIDSDPYSEDFQNRIDLYRRKYRNRIRNGETWQTVHSSIYDIDKKVITIRVQEDLTNEYIYSFAGRADFATESWVSDNYVGKNEYQDTISNVYEQIDEVEGKIPSLDGYATENYVQGVDAARKEWVIEQNYLTEHQDISGKADISYVDEQINDVRSEIPSLDGYATESWVEGVDAARKEWVIEQNYLTEHQDISGKADISYVDEHIDEVEGKIPSLDGYATESWVEGKGYLTEHQDISGKADKTYVDEQISDVRSEIPSLDGYATESWVEGKGYLTEHQSLDGYATEDYVQGVDTARKEWVIEQNYLTEHQDISGKMDKSDVWTGTEDEWNLLTDEQKASYKIALVR